MGKTERIFQLEAALRSGTPILDAPGWARKLKVDLRTLQRDLQFLRQTRKLPIHYDPELKGYRLLGPKPGHSAFPQDRLDRALELLRLLKTVQSEPGLTSSELADKMECSPRTVHRYRQELAKLNIVIHNNRGYRLSNESLVRAFTCQPTELLTLHVGTWLLQAHLPATLAPPRRASR